MESSPQACQLATKGMFEPSPGLSLLPCEQSPHFQACVWKPSSLQLYLEGLGWHPGLEEERGRQCVCGGVLHPPPPPARSQIF